MNGTGNALNTVVRLELDFYTIQHDGAVFVHFQNTFPDFDGQAVSDRQGVIFPDRNILRFLYFFRVVADYLTVLVITHIFFAIIGHVQCLVIADAYALVMSHRHGLVMPSGILLTHGDRLSQTYGDFLVVTDGFRVVHFHISGAVVQHFRIHVLLRMDIDLFLARRILKAQLVKSTAFVGFRADSHLRFGARQTARRTIVLVVGASHDDGLVRVAVEEVDYHFLAHARDGEVAKPGPGPCLRHPYPAGAVFVSRTIAVPVKTYPHTTMLIAEDFLARRAGNNGALRAVNGRFGQGGGAPCPVSRDDVQAVTERGAFTPVAMLRLWLLTFQHTAGYLPLPVECEGRVAGEGEPFSGPQFRGVARAGSGFCIMPEAFSQVAGKVLTVLLVLETSRIIEDFILGSLTVQVCGMVAEVTGPSGCFEGVILIFHRGRAYLCPVVELTDAFRGHFAGIRVKGQGAEGGNPGDVIAEHQFLVGAGRVEPVKEENAFFGPQAGQEGEVSFAVLYTELPRRVGFIKGRYPVGDAVFGEQGGGNGPDILLLKDAEVLTQATAPERRRNSQAVVHLPVVVFPGFHSGDDAVEIAQWGVTLPEGQRGVFLEETDGGEAGPVAGNIDSEQKGRGEMLVKGEADDSGCRRR